ncbi:MAG: hypothetical protein GXP42_17035 [Chloroflexi bacterium]|nr:hypothetical protein [Chloroflexota bacterium]
MLKSDTFDVLFLIARPAAGKSEIIDYLKRADEAERKRRFHIAAFDELDDFPMLWTWFEEDAILERMGKPRLHTDEQGYFKYDYLWHVLIERLDLEYHKLLRDYPDYHLTRTTIIEFARGREHGGFRAAFPHFSRDTLTRGAILYINVSWEESLRKNRRRFNPQRPDSILEHGLPDEKLERLYKEVDWEAFCAGDSEFVTVKGVRIPYVVFENEDDVTTARGPELGERLEETLARLWTIYARLHS